MKKVLALVSGLLVVGMVGVCSADTTNVADARIHVKVDPDIAVAAITSNVDMGSIQRGIIPGQVDFRVDANKQYVQLSVAASNLYKGDDPLYDGPDKVAPIEIVPSATIHPDNGTNPETGLATVAVSLGQAGTIGNYPSFGSSPVTFESAANGHFSQVVHTAFTWNQGVVEKPAGDYSGVVRLIATVLP
jgi:hypothetical protein